MSAAAQAKEREAVDAVRQQSQRPGLMIAPDPAALGPQEVKAAIASAEPE